MPKTKRFEYSAWVVWHKNGLATYNVFFTEGAAEDFYKMYPDKPYRVLPATVVVEVPDE